MILVERKSGYTLIEKIELKAAQQVGSWLEYCNVIPIGWGGFATHAGR